MLLIKSEINWNETNENECNATLLNEDEWMQCTMDNAANQTNQLTTKLNELTIDQMLPPSWYHECSWNKWRM